MNVLNFDGFSPPHSLGSKRPTGSPFDYRALRPLYINREPYDYQTTPSLSDRDPLRPTINHSGLCVVGLGLWPLCQLSARIHPHTFLTHLNHWYCRFLLCGFQK